MFSERNGDNQGKQDADPGERDACDPGERVISSSAEQEDLYTEESPSGPYGRQTSLQVIWIIEPFGFRLPLAFIAYGNEDACQSPEATRKKVTVRCPQCYPAFQFSACLCLDSWSCLPVCCSILGPVCLSTVRIIVLYSLCFYNHNCCHYHNQCVSLSWGSFVYKASHWPSSGQPSYIRLITRRLASHPASGE